MVIFCFFVPFYVGSLKLSQGQEVVSFNHLNQRQNDFIGYTFF